MDIIITIPKKTKWEDYQKELDMAATGEYNMNYQVRHFPRQAGIGDRCYVVYDGIIKGYMIITGMSSESFTCQTTGDEFEGNFIQRTGKFHKVKPVPKKSFRGFRYFGMSNVD